MVEPHLLWDGRDFENPTLAPQPSDIELLGIAIAAVRLQRGVARLEARLGAEELGGVGFRAARLAMVEEPRRLEAHGLGRFELRPRHGERVRDRLVLADRTIEDDSLLGVLHRAVKRGAPDAD